MENKKVEIKALQTVYGIGDNFFDTLDELRIFCGMNGRSTIGRFQLDYVGNYKGKKDVVRIWNGTSGKLYAVGNITADKLEKIGFDEYNCYEAYDEKNDSWRIYQGCLITWYRALRNSGAEFSNDVYAPVEQYLDEIRSNQFEQSKRTVKTIYGIENNFFDTLDELRIFCGMNGRSTMGFFQLDYIGDFIGKKDVICIWTHGWTKKDYYAVGNIPNDVLKKLGLTKQNCREFYDEGSASWKVCCGTLKPKYEALKERGVKLSNDVYAPVEEFLDEVKPTPTEPTTGGRQITIGTHPGTK